MTQRVNLSTVAKKNPHFKLSAYQTIHKAELNERMLKTLRRNDIDRPKVLKEKYDVFRQFEPQLIKISEVKRTVRQELKRRKQQKYSSHYDAHQNYHEILEYIHTRYEPTRKDKPERAIEINPFDQKIINEHKMLRLPVELERRFIEILYIIIVDSWELPLGSQWIDLLNFLNAFSQDS